jgi:hypothetical protein
VKFHVEPKGFPLPNIVCEFERDGIASFDGVTLKGISEGIVKARFYAYNDIMPIKVLNLKVITRNRIKELIFDEIELTFQEGATSKLRYSYNPPNADNADKIKFLSDNQSIAVVDDIGRIKLLKSGECRVYCSAEEISTVCRIIVKPKLQSVAFHGKLSNTGECITMLIHECININYECIPKDTFDKDINFVSTNYSVVTIESGNLVAKSIGSTTINAVHKYAGVVGSWNINVVKFIPQEIVTPPVQKKSFLQRLKDCLIG